MPLLLGGLINHNELLEKGGVHFVRRSYPKSRRKRQIEFELSILRFLTERGCPVPTPLSGVQRHPEEESALAGRPFVDLSFVPGEALSRTQALELDVRALLSLAKPLLKTLQTFVPPFSRALETRVLAGREKSYWESDRIAAPEKEELREEFFNLKAWEETLEGPLALPVSVVHADLHPQNWISDPSSSLHLIDFDSAHVTHRALDWVELAFEFSSNGTSLNEERYQEILGGLTEGQAEVRELEALPKLRRLVALRKKLRGF